MVALTSLDAELSQLSRAKSTLIYHTGASASYWSNASEGRAHFIGLISDTLDGDEYSSWDNLPNIDHHEAVYELMSYNMGLISRACHAHGLEMVVTREEPSYIGIIKPGHLPLKQEREYLSVKMEDDEDSIIYECVRRWPDFVDPETKKTHPAYSVIGV